MVPPKARLSPTSYTYGKGAYIGTAWSSHDGHTTAGWYTSSACTGSKVTPIGKQQGNKTFYAKKTANSYTITYKWSDGTTITGLSPTSYTYGKGATLAGVPSATGYTTAGWYTSSACTGNTVSSIGTTATGNKTFYAKKVASAFSITYKWSDGTSDLGAISGLTPTTFSTGTTPNLPAKSAVTNVPQYYTLSDVWFTDLACTSTNKTSKVPTGRTSNLTVYAKINRNMIKVHYDFSQKPVNFTAYTMQATDFSLGSTYYRVLTTATNRTKELILNPATNKTTVYYQYRTRNRLEYNRSTFGVDIPTGHTLRMDL